ncbi:hypothetical protein [Tautonia rosea]|uniref:hypothetical protein n=1 Tax=Tautonia rosea TaxID=2728037 RepID=UPI0014741D9A|nr:hypothetical protein [Tautonia rosea]
MPTNSECDSCWVSPIQTQPGTIATVTLIALVLLAGGCAPPQVEPEHRELILRLATATSVSDPVLLESLAEEIDALRAQGALRGAEEAAFDAIVTAGRAGDWERARSRAYALRDAQEPTAADIDRLKSRPLPSPKTLGQGDQSS